MHYLIQAAYRSVDDGSIELTQKKHFEAATEEEASLIARGDFEHRYGTFADGEPFFLSKPLACDLKVSQTGEVFQQVSIGDGNQQSMTLPWSGGRGGRRPC